MRKILSFSMVALLVGAGAARAAEPQLKTEDEKTLYALGASIGQGLTVFSLNKAELEIVKRGLSDAVTGQKLAANPAEYESKIRSLAQTRSETSAGSEKSKGKEFADKAAKEKGAVRTESGMVYKSLKEGTGASPKPTDTVKVNYRGTLINGTEFDSSYKRGQPAEFQLNQVIPCWTEGLQKMKVGGKAQLVCPSSIAYGDHGRPSIPGGATLVFEVELLGIIPAK